eukprot:TRINITY_DN6357_c1_g1_i1.p1 TRINITY_DN6357_c1_g1~~TRINITY_DN6357_c1_g1_i1.p1  ORF type:complete len:224 (-),score=22.72 TRINITY_DN6357_c1_g1_i1:74-745(-)
MAKRVRMKALGAGVGHHLLRASRCCNSDPEKMRLVWLWYPNHKLGMHEGCCDDSRGWDSRGDAGCKDTPSQIDHDDKEQQEEWLLFKSFIESPAIVSKLHIYRLINPAGTYRVESFHNVLSIYRDKNKTYTYYRPLVVMGGLDYEENRNRDTGRAYKCNVQLWKGRHTYRTTRKILIKKSIQWKYRVLIWRHPSLSHLWTTKLAGNTEVEEEEDEEVEEGDDE